MGAIADRARQIIPVSWDGLSGDARYGDDSLQSRIDTAKYELLGATAPVESNEDDLNPFVQEYIARMSVLNLIPAAIEFWIDKPITVSATGTEENVSYESRVEALKTLQADLLAWTRRYLPDVEALVTVVTRRRGGVPLVSSADDELLTPSPSSFGRPFAEEAT